MTQKDHVFLSRNVVFAHTTATASVAVQENSSTTLSNTHVVVDASFQRDLLQRCVFNVLDAEVPSTVRKVKNVASVK